MAKSDARFRQTSVPPSSTNARKRSQTWTSLTFYNNSTIARACNVEVMRISRTVSEGHKHWSKLLSIKQSQGVGGHIVGRNRVSGRVAQIRITLSFYQSFGKICVGLIHSDKHCVAGDFCSIVRVTRVYVSLAVENVMTGIVEFYATLAQSFLRTQICFTNKTKQL